MVCGRGEAPRLYGCGLIMREETVKEVKERLLEIHAARNTITPEIVVDDAKDPESVLHEHFEWDDSVAGHQWRLEQARTLIRSVRIVVEYEERSVSCPVFVRDPQVSSSEQGYTTITRLRDDAELARDAVAAECGLAAAAFRRAQAVAAGVGLEEDVRDLVVRTMALRERVSAMAGQAEEVEP